MLSLIPISSLVPSKTNPRKVKPEWEAHARLVASIRAHGLIHPLVVQPNGQKDQYSVIAGNRRLVALKEIHKGQSKVKVPCLIREVDPENAQAISLGENFVREPMHPLDEALAFARLAQQDGKNAISIAAEFGVSEHYVRQRMKLADLANPVAEAYRKSLIDTATAEVFASVPQKDQLAIWKEVEGETGANVNRIRQIINHSWISSEKAMFDISTLPEGSVTMDLFEDQVLIERSAFLKAQEAAVAKRQQALVAEGWNEVVVARSDEVRDQLYAMKKPEPIYSPEATKKLSALSKKSDQLNKKLSKLKFNHPRRTKLSDQIDAIDEQIEKIKTESPVTYSEEDKSKAVTFLICDPTGSVRLEHRLPNPKAKTSVKEKPKESLDSSQISDAQKAVLFTTHALAVRAALISDSHRCKVLLIMALHDKVRSDALAIRSDVNHTSIYAEQNQDFKLIVAEKLAEHRKQIDPFLGKSQVSDQEAYALLMKTSDSQLDLIIRLLTVNLVSNGLHHANGLVSQLSQELKVNLREHWTPDETWLKRFRKVQLIDLTTKLRGNNGASSADTMHTELVKKLANLFHDAKAGTLDDKKVAERASKWLPKEISTELPGR